MSREELQHLERLMNYITWHFLRKKEWKDVSKSEWANISAEFNTLLEKQQRHKRIKTAAAFFGENYFYEHLVIRKLKPWKSRKPLNGISSPNFARLNTIVSLLGYTNYIDFINNATDSFSFQELKINIPLAPVNTALLDNLVGCWYCYNRNLPYHEDKQTEERIWRSAMEIYRSGDEYLVERTGKGNHMYYGKITSYANYVFIIMNSTTFIRQRHFVGRVKDVEDRLARPGHLINELSFISTCVSFNEEPIALYEIFDRVPNAKTFQKDSVDLALDSPLLPAHILKHLANTRENRITDH
ncbi:hypothetical protein [Chitinophaga solisilvae]|uniref:Uncharacterized protein n=1 Tax=Chitinophaga solisilvae TaxID=1233460 RepID=A0A433WE55_9BACT|nr:hypothetical protein [Chitinophaga solisilvae]NSL86766.1 hypothetical protein [Chitinophaga solisilvae]